MRIVEARAMIPERNREHFVVEPSELFEITDKAVAPLEWAELVEHWREAA